MPSEFESIFLRLRGQGETSAGLAEKSPSREQLAAGEATEGDHDFKSSDANMQLLNPRVYEVLLIYR